MNEHGAQWRAITQHVNEETGELLTKHNAETNYIHVKTIKDVTFNKLRTKGTIHWTKLYRKNKQGNLFE